jgi:hypothetical protein
MTLLAACILWLPGRASSTAFEELELCVRAQAMGGTGVVMEGLDAIIFNPSAATALEGTSVTASSRLPFTSFDFATHGVDIGTRYRTAAFGLAVRYFGSELYNEQLIALTGALQLTDDMSLGIQPMLCRVDIGDGISSYGSATAISWNAGMRVRIYRRWRMGFAIRNPFQARIGSEEGSEHLHRRMDVGIGYEPEAGLVSQLALSRDFRGMRIHVGQSLPLGPVILRAGVHTDPVTISGGVGATVSGIHLEYAIQNHPDLNPTHQLGVSYDF